MSGRLAQELRYGENPHQWAAFYKTGDRRPGVATAAQYQGKELSYNNLNDTDAAFELVGEFDPKTRPAFAIIKPANPFGFAMAQRLTGPTPALPSDPESRSAGLCPNGTTMRRPPTSIPGILHRGGDCAERLKIQAIFAAKKNLRRDNGRIARGARRAAFTLDRCVAGFLVSPRPCCGRGLPLRL